MQRTRILLRWCDAFKETSFGTKERENLLHNLRELQADPEIIAACPELFEIIVPPEKSFKWRPLYNILIPIIGFFSGFIIDQWIYPIHLWIDAIITWVYNLI